MKMSSIEGSMYSLGKSKPRSNASKGHKLAYSIIREELPSVVIMEEVSIKVSDRDKSRQYLDLYLPDRCLVVEVHGRQHLEYIPHFHKSKMHFLKSQAKDRQKKVWCEINELNIVELFHHESENEWRTKIKTAIGRC